MCLFSKRAPSEGPPVAVVVAAESNAAFARDSTKSRDGFERQTRLAATDECHEGTESDEELAQLPADSGVDQGSGGVERPRRVWQKQLSETARRGLIRGNLP